MAASTLRPILNEARLELLRSRDLSGLIRLSNLFVPRLVAGFLPELDAKQRRAFDKIMPVGGQRRILLQIVGTPTPPIVIQLAQPLSISVIPEDEAKREGIKGIRIAVDDLPALAEGLGESEGALSAFRHLKGQRGAILGLVPLFMPLISLGPAEIKDLQHKAEIHFKPITSLLPS